MSKFALIALTKAIDPALRNSLPHPAESRENPGAWSNVPHPAEQSTFGSGPYAPTYQNVGPFTQDPAGTPPNVPRQPANYTRTLVGPLSANACRLLDEHRKEGIFFLFQDLSVRTEGEHVTMCLHCSVSLTQVFTGTFRLRMRLMNVGACVSHPVVFGFVTNDLHPTDLQHPKPERLASTTRSPLFSRKPLLNASRFIRRSASRVFLVSLLPPVPPSPATLIMTHFRRHYRTVDCIRQPGTKAPIGKCTFALPSRLPADCCDSGIATERVSADGAVVPTRRRIRIRGWARPRGR